MIRRFAHGFYGKQITRTKRSRPTTSTAPRRATPCDRGDAALVETETLAGVRLSKRRNSHGAARIAGQDRDNSGARRALVIRVLGGPSAATRARRRGRGHRSKDAIPTAR